MKSSSTPAHVVSDAHNSAIFKEAVPPSQASHAGLPGLEVPLNAGVMRRFERVVALPDS
ncbi:MAG TPA: hypothetical protein VJ023_07405 [Pyrinomonadaceae bacterium]|nr:hypothetical protein [Pyrinomonadaceae bacterium]